MDKNKKRINIENDLELERADKKRKGNEGYDFIPRSTHWTSPEEQRLKVGEIESITKK